MKNLYRIINCLLSAPLALALALPPAYAHCDEGGTCEHDGTTTMQCQQATGAGSTAATSCQSAASHLNLDLTSTVRSVCLGTDIFHSASQATITVAGAAQAVRPGDCLTPAQYVALQQVLSGQSQTLLLDSAGRGASGNFSLNAVTTGAISALTIPANVVATTLSSSNVLNISGSLVSQGTLLGLPGVAQSVNIQAGSVQVGTGGAITTQIPATLASIFGGSSGSPLNLSIASLGNIINGGSITASGVLNLTAAGSIVNQLPANAAAGCAPPVMAGALGTNLFSGAGTFTNAGIIASELGRVTFNTGAARDLVLNNIGGQILARQANIDLRNDLYSAKDLTAVIGGLLEAQNIKAFGGNGLVKLNCDRLNGLVDILGGEAHVNVSDGVLTIGRMQLTGDPTIANSGGDVVLGGSLGFFGQDLAILSSGSIRSSDPGMTTIELWSPLRGGNLTMVAGFDFTPSTSGQTGADRTTTYVMGAPNASGGSILLPNTHISVQSAWGNGGNVIAVANKGSIQLASINAESADAVGGNVLLIAPGGVSVPGIVNTRGAWLDGQYLTMNMMPQISGGVISVTNGTASGTGNFIGVIPSGSIGGTVTGNITEPLTFNYNADTGRLLPVTAEIRKDATVPSNTQISGVTTGVYGIAASGLPYFNERLSDPADRHKGDRSQPGQAQGLAGGWKWEGRQKIVDTGEAEDGLELDNSSTVAFHGHLRATGERSSRSGQEKENGQLQGAVRQDVVEHLADGAAPGALRSRQSQGTLQRSALSRLAAPLSGNEPNSAEMSLTQAAHHKGATGNAQVESLLLKLDRDRNMVMFTAANQVFTGPVGGSNDSFISGSNGTTFSRDRNMVMLHTGHLLADNGRDPLTVSTRLGTVTIDPNSTAVIDVQPGKPVRIMAVGGSENSRLSLKLGKAGEQLFSISPGEELVLSDATVNDEDLIPADGIERHVVTAGLHIRGKALTKNSFAVEEFMEKELMVGGQLIRIAGNSQSRLLGHISMAARAQNPDFDPKASSLSPGKPALHGALSLYAGEGTVFGHSGDGHVDLKAGTLFLNTPDATTIKTALADVHACKNALVSVEASGHQIRVKSCSGPGHIHVTAGKHEIALAPGEELFLSDGRPSKADILPRDGVGRRELTAYALDDKLTAVVGEFSLITLLSGSKHMHPVRQGLTSDDRRVQEHFLKTAAALQHVTGGHGRYYTPPSETALIPEWPFRNRSTAQM